MQNDVRYARQKTCCSITSIFQNNIFWTCKHSSVCSICFLGALTCPYLSLYVPDNTNLRPRDPVFPEQDIILSCPATNVLGNIDWKFQGEIVQQSMHYVFSLDRLSLTVKSVTIRDNGESFCPWQIKAAEIYSILSQSQKKPQHKCSSLYLPPLSALLWCASQVSIICTHSSGLSLRALGPLCLAQFK